MRGTEIRKEKFTVSIRKNQWEDPRCKGIIGVTAVLRLVYQLNNIWSAVFLWGPFPFQMYEIWRELMNCTATDGLRSVTVNLQNAAGWCFWSVANRCNTIAACVIRKLSALVHFCSAFTAGKIILACCIIWYGSLAESRKTAALKAWGGTGKGKNNSRTSV